MIGWCLQVFRVRKHVQLGVVGVDNHEPAAYRTNVLTFGAPGSVAGFLRISDAIRLDCAL